MASTATASVPPPSSSWNTSSNVLWCFSLTIVLEFLAVTAVVLRLYSHRISRQGLALHDCFILVGLLFSTLLVALILTAILDAGLGQHVYLLENPARQLVAFQKIYVATSSIWGTAISAIKISILFLYIRIFPSSIFRQGCYALIALQATWWVAVILESLLVCRPLAYNWDPTIVGGTCGDIKAAYLAAHCINLFLDVAVALIPTPVLWPLQMKRSKKIALSLMFGLGITICAITIARIALVQQLDSQDATYTSILLFFFASVECLLGVVLACLPVIRPAAQKLMTYCSSHVSKFSSRRTNATGGLLVARSKSSRHAADQKDFNRLHDPLNSTTDGKSSHSDVEAYQFDNMSTVESQTAATKQPASVIRVTNSWNVTT